ncbi:MAG: aspartyl/glutamyl-tRNA amidotransferase subunit C [Patescibacteria group bacterium]|nr:aspartyl/glutamyl-tRNA amidotransferase subunit C [Patescibacteria group bacterium]
MLTKKEIEKIAELAKIKLSENEENVLFKDINDILDYVKKIQKYKVSKNIKVNNYKDFSLRRDEIKDFPGDLLISQFSDKKDKLLRVKKVL